MQRSTPTSTCAIQSEDLEAATTPTIHNRKGVKTVEKWTHLVMCIGHVCLNSVGFGLYVCDGFEDYDGLDCMFVMNYVELCVFGYVMDGFLWSVCCILCIL